MSLAASFGIDARDLLTTDDLATHLTFDKVIAQAREFYIERIRVEEHNAAVAIVNMIGEHLIGRGKA